MTRIDRLELVVRSLADRILGEEITFDAIAEQEAAEQGVAYVAPSAPAAEPVDVAPVLEAIESLSERVAALEQRPGEQVDITPVLDGLANLSERIAVLEQVSIQEGSAPVAGEMFDPAPLHAEIEALQSKLSTKDAQHIKQERLLQTMAQVVDDLQSRVGVIEQIDITLLDERKAG